MQIDGGVNLETIVPSAKAGVDICVAGTSVFRAQSPTQMIQDLKKPLPGKKAGKRREKDVLENSGSSTSFILDCASSNQ